MESQRLLDTYEKQQEKEAKIKKEKNEHVHHGDHSHALADIYSEKDDKELTDITQLMIRLNKYGNSRFKNRLDLELDGQDKKRFEIDLRYFVKWFRKNENRMKEKFEYFYGPILDDQNMI